MTRYLSLSMALGVGMLGFSLHARGESSPAAEEGELRDETSPLEFAQHLVAEDSGGGNSSPEDLLDLSPGEGALPASSLAAITRDLPEPTLELHGGFEPRASRVPNRVLAASELGLMVLTGGVEYWTRKDYFPHFGVSSWRERFSTTEWFVLDRSTFATNYSHHTFAGAGYHLITRTNDIGVFESALWSLGASLAWEYVVEYRQKIDKNDIFYTTPAGIAMGEFTHSLGRLLQQQPAGGAWDLARWTLGFGQSLNDSLAGAESPRGPAVSHRFRMSMGASRAEGLTAQGEEEESEHTGLYQLRVEGALATMEDLYRRGTGWRGFADGNFTSLSLRVSGGGEQNSGTEFFSDTFLAGWRYTDIDPHESGGKAMNLGTATSVHYQREQYGTWKDRLGMAHLPGLAADGEVWGRDWKLRGRARLHADYGGVDALSNHRWRDAHPDEVGLSTIEAQGYYHAYGLSGRLGAELELPRLRAGGELFLARYWPHHGRDKLESELTTKQSIGSRYADYRLWLRSPLPSGFFVEMRMDSRRRWERFEEFDARAHLRRYALEFGRSF